MICSTSFSNKLLRLLSLLCLAALAGCAGLRAPEPRLTALQASPGSPQAAYGDEILWTATTAGESGSLHYEFTLWDGERETLVQQGEEQTWRWRPRFPGAYRIGIRVSNAAGKSSTLERSFHVAPSVDETSLIAVLPVENISAARAPLAEIGAACAALLRTQGMNLLAADRLERFMERHRMRYTGGLDTATARALRDEEGVAAVLITSLESYEESAVPKIALTSRLVLCRERPVIVWIDGVGMGGDDAPGLLGINRITRMEELREQALERLFVSLNGYLTEQTAPLPRGSKKVGPKDYYKAGGFDGTAAYRLAVVPFPNPYARKNAGFVVPLQFVKTLSRHRNLEVVEPGLVREQLLKYRLIMQAGPSLAISDVLAGRHALAADLILSGYVFDYQDQSENPKIDFATRLFSGPERKIVWWSRSYAGGSDGVYFFDFGRYKSAHVMLQEMSQVISRMIFSESAVRPVRSVNNPAGHDRH